MGDFPDPLEDGATFLDNAAIKASAALDHTGLRMAVADDSGLCVDELQGAPGIHSARWAGMHGDDEANNAKLLKELADVPAERRRAHFHSTVVLIRVTQDGIRQVFQETETVLDRLALRHEVSGGFGYDPLFLLMIRGQHHGELTVDEKNASRIAEERLMILQNSW